MKPEISSPYTNVQYFTRTNSNKNEQIQLAAITDADVQHMYWFLNEEFLGKSKVTEPYYWNMRPGTYTLRVIDDHGRSDTKAFSVLLTQ